MSVMSVSFPSVSLCFLPFTHISFHFFSVAFFNCLQLFSNSFHFISFPFIPCRFLSFACIPVHLFLCVDRIIATSPIQAAMGYHSMPLHIVFTQSSHSWNPSGSPSGHLYHSISFHFLLFLFMSFHCLSFLCISFHSL